jgi:hypothetical protein
LVTDFESNLGQSHDTPAMMQPESPVYIHSRLVWLSAMDTDGDSLIFEQQNDLENDWTYGANEASLTRRTEGHCLLGS